MEKEQKQCGPQLPLQQDASLPVSRGTFSMEKKVITVRIFMKGDHSITSIEIG